MDTIRRALMDGDHNLLIDGLVSDPDAILQSSVLNSQPAAAHFNLDILSASTYPQPATGAARQSRKPKSSNAQPVRHLFGGMLEPSTDDAGFDRADDEPANQKPAPRKRSKKSPKSDDDDGGKKQRGRPRLNTRDETAAERRRTQIRLAQRAYRHRKETTISGLKKRVSELENGIGLMSNTFVQFQEDAIESGLLASRPDLIDELRAVAEQFSQLSETALAHSDQEDENAGEPARSNSLVHSPERITHTIFDSEQPRDTEMDNPLGFRISFDESGSNEEESASPSALIPLDASVDLSQNGMHGIVPEEWPVVNEYWQSNAFIPDEQSNIQLLAPQIDRPLASSGPYTYSFQETTFARRLHRLCLERGFRLLTNPKQHEEAVVRTFRFSFCFSNKKYMLSRFQELLKRKAGESLEHWNVPFFRVGGAGTHFPRRDDQGKPVYPPNMLPAARAFGPLPSLPYANAETPRDEGNIDKIIDSLGFGGEWFDSHDVEEYLRSKGLRFDGQSSFVDVDPLLISTPALVRTDSASPTQSEESVEFVGAGSGGLLGASHGLEDGFQRNFVDEYTQARVSVMQDKFLNEGLVEGANVAMWDQNMESSKPSTSRWTASFRDVLERRQQLVTVDVGKFLEHLVEGSACLGRAPGFRRQDVDRALYLALQEAF